MSRFVQRSDERFVSHGPGWVGRYCFSYDEHYDAANVALGPLVACNELVVEPGAGFPRHRHAGVDIVTVVLAGVLTHVEPGCEEQRVPGAAYVFPTGAGAEHEERNDGDVPVRFVQAWLLPGTPQPRPLLLSLAPGERAVVPVAPHLLLLVTDGTVAADDLELGAGDSVRVRDEPVEVLALAPTRLLAWRV